MPLSMKKLQLVGVIMMYVAVTVIVHQNVHDHNHRMTIRLIGTAVHGINAAHHVLAFRLLLLFVEPSCFALETVGAL